MILFRSWWMIILIVLIYARSAEFADDQEEDQCARCDPNAKCEGDHCECLEGFEGNGLKCTKIVKQCGNCSPNAKCTNGECHCNPGFVGNGTVCKKGNVTLQNPGPKVDVDDGDRQTRNKDAQTTDDNSNSNTTVTEKSDTVNALHNQTEEKPQTNLAENGGDVETRGNDKNDKENNGKQTKEKESTGNVPTSSPSTLSPNELPTKASSASSSKESNPTLPLPPSKSSNPTKMGVTMKNKNPEKAGPTLKPSTTPSITKAATKTNTTEETDDSKDASKKDDHSNLNIMNELHNASIGDDDSLLKAVAKSSGVQMTPTAGLQTSPRPTGLPSTTEEKIKADEKAPEPSSVKQVPDEDSSWLPGLVEGKGVPGKGIEAKDSEGSLIEAKGKGGEGGDEKGLAPLPTNDKGVEAKSVEGKGIDGKGIDEKITEGKGIEGKDIDGKGIGTEGKGVEGKGIEGKGIEGKGIEGKGIEGKGIEGKEDRIPIEGKVPLPTLPPPTTPTKPPSTLKPKKRKTTPRKWMPSFPTPKLAPFPPISYQLPSIVLPPAPAPAPPPAFFVNTHGAESIRKIELLKHKALFSNPHPKDPDAMLFPIKSLDRKLTGDANKHSNTPIRITTGQ